MESRSERECLPRRFWRLWWAGAIDNVGNGAFLAAVPLLAISITDDARTISLTTVATLLPWLLLAVPAGVLADRASCTALMLAAQVAQAVIVGFVAVLVAIGALTMPVLISCAFLLGSSTVVFSIASQSVLPQIVPGAQLTRANAHQSVATTVGQSFVGPPLGSALFTLAAVLPFGLNAASFVVSGALLARLRVPRLNVGESLSPFAAAREGMRWLARHRLLRGLAILLAVNTFCFQLANTTLVLLATWELDLSPAAYGLLLTAAAAGSLAGGLMNHRLVARLGAMPTLLGALALNAITFVAIGFTAHGYALAALLALSGLATVTWNVITVSLRQELVPAPLLGRVSSLYRLLGWGLSPLGALCGGILVETFGARAAYPIAGGIRALALAFIAPLIVKAYQALKLRSLDGDTHDSSRRTE